MKTPAQIHWLTAVVLLLSIGPVEAAQKTPVEWHVKASPAKPIKAAAKFSVTIVGQLDPGWHLYALEEPQGGPIATEIALTEGDPADLLHVEEGKPRFQPDPVTQKPAGYFENLAEFTLRLQAGKEAGPGSLRVLVRYQSCNDRICLPPRTDTVVVPIALVR